MGCQVERPLQVVAHFSGLAQHDRILGHRADDIDDVDLLVTQLAEGELGAGGDGGLLFDMTGEVERRDRIEPLTDDAGEGVGSTWTAGDVHDGQAAGGAEVALGGDGAGLLVVVVDTLEAWLTPEGIVKVTLGRLQIC